MKRVASDPSDAAPIAPFDDAPRGRLLSRKEVLALMAGAVFWPMARGMAAESGKERPCIARPELTAGPFYVDTDLERSDIRVGLADGKLTPGVPLALCFNVSRFAGESCVPLAGAVVDVWHCDAAGFYSGVNDRRGSTEEQRFLRGFQRTDAEGGACFTTIYPGWYPGRTVHIHFTIRSTEEATKPYTFTSQLFFDDALTDAVHGRPPYATAGPRDRRNEDDWIFRRGGDQLMLEVQETGEGYAAAFDIAVQV